MTYLPGEPVNTSATWNGCEKKRSILRARDTTACPLRTIRPCRDRDDVLEFLVLLQCRLDLARGVVVLVADYVRIELARGRIQRIDRRIDAERRDVARQHHGGVEVANVVAGDGSVRSSAGTYTAWIEVIEPVLVEVLRSCSTPISSARVGW